MANPNPKTEQLQNFPMIGDEPLSAKVYGARLPVQYAAALEALKEGRAAWIRRVLCKAVEEEGLL